MVSKHICMIIRRVLMMGTITTVERHSTLINNRQFGYANRTFIISLWISVLGIFSYMK